MAPVPAQTLSTAGEVVTIDTAEASLEPEGKEWRAGTISLVERWDVDFPGRGGRAVYTVALPARTGPEPMAVFFSRVGNQVLVRVNGVTVQRWGTLGNARYDAAKNPLMIVLPAALLHEGGPNEMVVEVTIQPQRWGGLSVVRYGPQAAVQAIFDDQLLWRHAAMVVFAASLAGMGSLAGMLWWRQRDPLYGWFSLAAFLGVVRNVDRVWPDVPVPWPLWGAIVAVCYACHLALICRFTLMALGPVPRGLNRAVSVVLLLTSTLAILSFSLARPLFWTLGLALLVPLGVVSLVVIAREAIHTKTMTAWVLAAAGTIAVVAGIYDLGLIRMTHSSGLRSSYTQHAMFVFVVFMAVLVAERYSRSVADYRALNTDLSRRVADREQQLRGAFDSLREQQHQQSVSTERQRIMREIHDGIGSHLVGLLNMVTRPNADPVALQAQVQLALDEMRMAVDSLQPVHDDLITVLATLRYRLQPRLQAAGIEVVWDVAELPSLRQLSPHAVLQVQRILLEAFTNVLKHARATQVAVRTRWHEADSRVSLQITDNGIGLRGMGPAQDKQVRGRGIGNMRSRAVAIGAELRVVPARSGGVCVMLDWQVESQPPPEG
jgi:signal transduction histidine kinase